MLKQAVGIVFVVGVLISAGVWAISTSDKTTGFVTLMIGIVSGIFLIVATIGQPALAGGRSEPSPD